MATHDIEFAANNANRCAMIFEGGITSSQETGKFLRKTLYNKHK